VTIGLYLGLVYAAGAQGDVKAGASGLGTLIGRFQGKAS
jgi:hypothetical protein